MSMKRTCPISNGISFFVSTATPSSYLKTNEFNNSASRPCARTNVCLMRACARHHNLLTLMQSMHFRPSLAKKTREFPCPNLRQNSLYCFGACEAASFWKRGSFRSGSNIGSSRSSARVSSESCPKTLSIVSAQATPRFFRSAGLPAIRGHYPVRRPSRTPTASPPCS